MGRQARPGETIRIKNGSMKDQEFVVIECPQRFKGGTTEHYTWVEDNLSAAMYLVNPGDYEIVNTEWAMPGDTIEVTYIGINTGARHLVIEAPFNALKNPEGCAWHDNPGRKPSFWRKEYYKIVKRKGESVSTPSIGSDTPVDLEKSLRRKRDQLLRGYFT